MAEPRLVFVGGLHRSGTTLLARCLAEHPLVSGFDGTGAPADEGQHLQTAYPSAREFGGPGRFAFDPLARLSADSPLVSAATRAQLLEEWGRHWDPTKPVLVEKSPPNLVRGRFLQELFPQATLVMVLRHPVPVAYATQKWSHTSLRSLLRHWLAAHDAFAADRPHLESLHVLRFEDLVADPDATLAVVYRFLGLEPVPVGVEVRPAANERYLNRWRKDRLRRAILGRLYEERVSAFGYSLRDPDRLEAPSSPISAR